MKNRRITRRISLEEKMAASITYNDTLKYIVGCCICNVSSKSMFLESTTVLEKNAYVNLKVHSEKLIGKPLWIQGLVVRTDRNGMAIEITHSDTNDIDHFMTNILDK